MENETIANKNTFLLNRSELTGRLDPYFNYHLKNSQLTSVFEDEALYKLCKPFSGGTPSKSNPEYWDGDIPWVSPKDFKGLYLHDSEDHISEKGLSNSSTKLVPANSILVVVRSGVLIHSLPVTINKVPVTINQDLKAFVIKDERILPEYLGMYFYVFGKQLLPLITKHSTTVQSINTDQFSKLRIPIPDKLTQQRIVDLINISIKQKEDKESKAEILLSQIDNYLCDELGIILSPIQNTLEDRIFETSLSSLTGGRYDPKYYDSDVSSLKRAIQNSTYHTFQLRHLITQSIAGDWGKDLIGEEEFDENFQKCLVIRATEFDNAYNLKLSNSRVKHRLIHKDKLEKINIQKDDILIEKSGGSPDQPVGRVAIIDNDAIGYTPLCYSNFVHKIKVDTSRVNPSFLFHYLKLTHNLKLTEAMQSQTNGIRNLIMTYFLKQDIPLPNLDVQLKISNHVDSLKKQIRKSKSEAKDVIEETKNQVREMIING